MLWFVQNSSKKNPNPHKFVSAVAYSAYYPSKRGIMDLAVRGMVCR